MTGIFPGRGIFLPGRGIFQGKACTFFSFSVVYILISCFAFQLVRRQTRRVNNKSMNFWKFTTLYLMLHIYAIALLAMGRVVVHFKIVQGIPSV